MDTSTRLINIHEILLCNSRRRSKQFNLVNAGLYPKPIRFGRSAFWLASEDETVRRAVISGKSDDEIRKIVRELENDRKGAYSQPTWRSPSEEQTVHSRLGTPAAPE